MKQNNLIQGVRAMILTVFACLLGFWAMAQEGGGTGEGGGGSVSVSTKTETASSSGWYTSPWVWVVGAAVFILLLVALLNNRGGSKSNN